MNVTGDIVVLDVGKTLSKLTLWTVAGQLVERRTRANERLSVGGRNVLDAIGIEAWITETLTDFASLAPIAAIIPVGHGAAAAVVREGLLAGPPVDYECPVPPVERAKYDAMRDAFAMTGSPALPDGLNLGAQLHMLEAADAQVLKGATVLPWPQYWAWVLSGIGASEVSSLGCHSDLWRPLTASPSALAVRRGWAERLAPLRGAGDVLGRIRPELAARTGLSANVEVYCGLHDSNAALLAARGIPEIADYEATVLSTGTWFVAMRSQGPSATDVGSLCEARDCLLNVDIYGRPIPSARFMGGREIEILTGADTGRIDVVIDQPQLLAAVPETLRSGAMALPTFSAGCGPFPDACGAWIDRPTNQTMRRAAIALYAALVADVSLDLIGAEERLLVEGRFAQAQVFVRALAALRPDTVVYTADTQNEVSFGALRLINPDLKPASGLTRVEPLEGDLSGYRRQWRLEAERNRAAT